MISYINIRNNKKIFGIALSALLLASCDLQFERSVELDPSSEYDFALKPGYILDQTVLFCKAEGSGVLGCVSKVPGENNSLELFYNGKYVISLSKRNQLIAKYFEKSGFEFGYCSSPKCSFTLNGPFSLNLLWRNQKVHGNQFISNGYNDITLMLPQIQKYLQGDDDDLTKIRINDDDWLTDQIILSMNTYLDPDDRVTIVKKIETYLKPKREYSNSIIYGQFTVKNIKNEEIELYIKISNSFEVRVFTKDHPLYKHRNNE